MTGRLAGSRPPQVTRRMAADLARHADLHAPNRARAVLSYLDAVDAPIVANHEDRRRQNRKRSPAKAKQRRQRWVDPTPEELEQRELNRLMRNERVRSPDDDGLVSGPLAVVARYATPHLLNDFGLDEIEREPFEHWLMAKFGDVLRDPDVAGYLAWREAGKRIVQLSR